MFFEEQLQNIAYFLRDNPVFALILGGVILLLFLAKPKEMFQLVGFCLFISVVFYFIILFAETVDTGSKEKDEMIYKTRRELDK